MIKNLPAGTGDTASISESGGSPGDIATHSGILSWEIPWTEKPGRLQPMGSQRVGHDRTLTHAGTQLKV